MSQIQIHRTHPFSKDEARQRVDAVRGQLKEKLGIDADWQGDHLAFNGRGAKGQITVTDKDIEVNIALGLLLSAFAPKLKEKIEQGLDEAIQKA